MCFPSCTTAWISCMYNTPPPSWASLSPPPHPSRLGQRGLSFLCPKMTKKTSKLFRLFCFLLEWLDFPHFIEYKFSSYRPFSINSALGTLTLHTIPTGWRVNINEKVISLISFFDEKITEATGRGYWITEFTLPDFPITIIKRLLTLFS